MASSRTAASGMIALSNPSSTLRAPAPGLLPETTEKPVYVAPAPSDVNTTG